MVKLGLFEEALEMAQYLPELEADCLFLRVLVLTACGGDPEPLAGQLSDVHQTELFDRPHVALLTGVLLFLKEDYQSAETRFREAIRLAQLDKEVEFIEEED
jgi:hypothetical protein